MPNWIWAVIIALVAVLVYVVFFAHGGYVSFPQN